MTATAKSIVVLGDSISAGYGIKVAHGDNLGITPANNLTLPQREFLKLHRTEIISELSIYQKIKNWLAFIGETDQEVIDEIINH
jgi:lysophospholipase L1-like esterase